MARKASSWTLFAILLTLTVGWFCSRPSAEAMGGKPGRGGSTIAPTMTSPIGDSKPYDILFKKAGVPHLSKRVTHLWCAPLRWQRGQRSKAHWMWRRYKGDLEGTLSRPNVKNVVYKSTLTQYAAGQVDRAGTIEPAATQKTYDLDDWLDGSGSPKRAVRTKSQLDVAGGYTANTVQEDGDTGAHYIYDVGRDIVCAANTVASFRVYVKRIVGTRNAGFQIFDPIVNGVVTVSFSLDTGSVNAVVTGDGSHLVSYANEVGGGWWELNTTCIPSASGANIRCALMLFDGTTLSYAGDNASSITFSHPLVVLADYPSSTIVGGLGTTRSADTLSFSDASGFGSIAPEGCLFGVVQLPYKPSVLSANTIVASLDYNNDFNDAAGGSHYITVNASGNRLDSYRYRGAAGGGQISANNLGDFAAGTVVAYALSWDGATFQLVVNGTNEGTASATTSINLDRLKIGSIGAGGTHAGSHLLVGTLDKVPTVAEMQALTGANMRSYLEDLAGV